MEVYLKRAKIKNFKGLEEKTIDFSKVINIKGPNKSCKSTIQDAITWCLFGKDSEDNSGFSIINLYNDISYAEVSVILDVAGEEKELTRVLEETWKQNRSQVEKYKHTTSYFINNVPKKQKEYNQFISSIVGTEENFKLLTDIFYFTEKKKKKKEKRKMLLSLVENWDEQDYIEKFKKEGNEINIPEGTTVEERQEKLKYQMKQLNKDLEGIPERIQEQQNNLVNEDEIKRAEAELQTLLDKKEEIQQSIMNIQKQNEGYNKKSQELQNKREEREKLFNSKIEEKQKELREKIKKKNNEINEKDSKIEEAKNIKQKNEKKLERKKSLDQDLEELRKKFRKTKSEEYEPEEKICPNCGYDLNQDGREEARKKFIKDKNSRLQEINRKGQELKQQISEIALQENYNIEELQKEKKELQQEKEELQQEQNNINEEVKKYEEIKGLDEEIKALEKELKEKNQLDYSNYQRDLEEVEKQINQERKIANKREQNEKINKRIRELKTQEEEKNQEITRIKGELDSIDKFYDFQYSIIENQVAEFFNQVHFKLFEKQKNGEVKATCKVMLGRVPYADMSNSERIIAGLDIVKNISKIKGIYAPIFIDNREGVTVDLDYNNHQVVNLIAKPIKKMRIETEQE